MLLCGLESASSGSSLKKTPSFSPATRTLTRAPILFCGYQKSQVSSLCHHFPAWKTQIMPASPSAQLGTQAPAAAWSWRRSGQFSFNHLWCCAVYSPPAAATYLVTQTLHQRTPSAQLLSGRRSRYLLHPQTCRAVSSLGSIIWLESSDVPEVVAPSWCWGRSCPVHHTALCAQHTNTFFQQKFCLSFFLVIGFHCGLLMAHYHEKVCLPFSASLLQSSLITIFHLWVDDWINTLMICI